MTDKEKYENQKNFCSEFMKCFLDLYVDGVAKMNRQLAKHIEIINKDSKEREKKSKVCKDSSLLNYGYYLKKGFNNELWF